MPEGTQIMHSRETSRAPVPHQALKPQVTYWCRGPWNWEIFYSPEQHYAVHRDGSCTFMRETRYVVITEEIVPDPNPA